MAHYDDKRIVARRTTDEWKYWLPLIVSLATSMLTVGMIYGKLGGRLDLIEYRLHRIEIVLKLEQ